MTRQTRLFLGLVHQAIDMPPTDEVSEVRLNQGVFNRAASVIWLEVAVGYIGLMCAPVWQYVIPRTILRRSGTRHGFVPFVGSFELRINTDNYTPVVE